MDRIGAGTLLAGRYRLQEEVHADPISALWLASDVTLQRPVAVRVLSADHPRVQATLEAARRTALVDDPRLQRVLGVGAEAGSGYIVLEWLTGQAMHTLAGQVTQGQAVRILREAAEALESARGRGLSHGQLTPASIMRATDGSIRVGGTATEAAAAGTPSEGPAHDALRDVHDLAAVLYAVLTGRWPFGFANGMLPAPSEGGQPLRADRVVSWIHPELAAMCERAMAGTGPRTPGQLAEWLGAFEAAELDADGQAGAPVPAGGSSAGGVVAATAGGGLGAPRLDDTDVLPLPSPRSTSDDPAPSTVSLPGPGPAAGPGGAAAAAAAPGERQPVPAAGSQYPGWGTAAGWDDQAAVAAPSASSGREDDWSILPGGDPQEHYDEGYDAAYAGSGYEPAGYGAPGDSGGYPGWHPSPGGYTEGYGPDAYDTGQPVGSPYGYGDAGPAAYADPAVAAGAAAAAAGAAAPAATTVRERRARPAASGLAVRGTGLAALLVVAGLVGAGLVWAISAIGGEGGEPTDVAEAPVVVTETAPDGSESEPAESSPEAELSPEGPRTITPAAVRSLDPGGDDQVENDQEAPRAIDGDGATAWTSQRYNSASFGNLKDGLGLLLDLGAAEDISGVEVTAPGDGGQLELRTATEPFFEGSTVVASGPTGSAPLTLAPESPVSSRFIIVWFTQLPSNDGDWRAVVNEVQVQVQ